MLDKKLKELYSSYIWMYLFGYFWFPVTVAIVYRLHPIILLTFLCACMLFLILFVISRQKINRLLKNEKTKNKQ
jgi:ABC-type protease/lipase transport system fused ATPase/permease subunit